MIFQILLCAGLERDSSESQHMKQKYRTNIFVKQVKAFESTFVKNYSKNNVRTRAIQHSISFFKLFVRQACLFAKYIRLFRGPDIRGDKHRDFALSVVIWENVLFYIHQSNRPIHDFLSLDLT